MKPMIVVLSLFCSLAALADELPKFDALNVGTKSYRGVKVTAIEPSGIRFTHDSGAARAKFEELDAETRAKFTFDPEAAKKFEAEKQHARVMSAAATAHAKMASVAAAEEEGKAQEVKVKADKILPDGILGTWWDLEGGFTTVPMDLKDPIKGSSFPARWEPTGRTVFLEATPPMTEGDMFWGNAVRAGTKEIGGRVLQRWVSKGRVDSKFVRP